MKHIKIPYSFGKFFYEISHFTGELLQYDSLLKGVSLPKKISDALIVCNNPYLIRTDICESQFSSPSLLTIKKINKMHDWFLFMGNQKFYISLLYSRFRKPLFENTFHAFTAIRNHIPLQVENKNKLCLQRSLLALKTSKSFKESGVLFIGASLPTGNMHAWIIESNSNPDLQDREWIMYKPLLAFYF